MSGFTRLAPDLIVLASPQQGDRIHAVLTPKEFTISLDTKAPITPPLEYLSIGIEHIVFGLDHVLFVAGLYLLWRKRKQNVKQLIGQFTLFTVGHSLTLALLVLGWIAVPTRAIEAWIALSVLWLAWEPGSRRTGSTVELVPSVIDRRFWSFAWLGFCPVDGRTWVSSRCTAKHAATV